MRDIAIYMLEVMVCSGVLLALYRLCLERRVAFWICRLTLLLSLVVSCVIPVLDIPVWEGETVYVEASESAELSAKPVPVPIPIDDFAGEFVAADVVVEPAPIEIEAEDVFWAVYLLGVAVLLGGMLNQLRRIWLLHRVGEVVQESNPRIVRTSENISSFSFFGTIYLCTQSECDAAVMAHECSHIRHRHSLERLLMELLRALLWWNPFAWMSRRLLAEVHEYEADSDVIERGYDKTTYMKSILESVIGYSPEVANGLRDSLTKKRFLMITSNPKSRYALLRVFALLPVVVALLCIFSFTAKATQYVERERASSSNGTVVYSAGLVLGVQNDPAAAPQPQEQTPNTSTEYVAAEEASVDVSVVESAPTLAPVAEPQPDGKDKKLAKKEGKYSGEVYYAEDKGLSKAPTLDGKSIDEVRKYVRENVKMPKGSIKLGNTGGCSVSVIIETDGTLSLHKDVAFIDEYMSQELRRVIKSLKGRWQPAEIDGKKVRTMAVFSADFYQDFSDELPRTINEAPATAFQPLGGELVPAKYDGGDIEALHSWVKENYKPYGEMEDRAFSGEVDIQYTISAEGRISLHSVKRSPWAEVLADQLVEFMQSAPGKVSPATSDGKPYSSIQRLKFHIDAKPEPQVVKAEFTTQVVTNPTFMGGGINRFREYVQQNMRYPEEALKQGVTGRIMTNFIIRSKDKVEIHYTGPYNKMLADEVKRVIMSSVEYWQNGKSSDDKYDVPPYGVLIVDFCIEQDGKTYCEIDEYFKGITTTPNSHRIAPVAIVGKLESVGKNSTIAQPNVAGAKEFVAKLEKVSDKTENQEPQDPRGVVLENVLHDDPGMPFGCSAFLTKVVLAKEQTRFYLHVKLSPNWKDLPIIFRKATYLWTAKKNYYIRSVSYLSPDGKITAWELDKQFPMPKSREATFVLDFAPLPKNTARVHLMDDYSGGWTIHSIILNDKRVVR